MSGPSPELLAVIVKELPQAIALIREAFMHAHPDEPVPTSEDVIAGYRALVTSTLMIDVDWQAANPVTPDA